LRLEGQRLAGFNPELPSLRISRPESNHTTSSRTSTKKFRSPKFYDMPSPIFDTSLWGSLTV